MKVTGTVAHYTETPFELSVEAPVVLAGDTCVALMSLKTASEVRSALGVMGSTSATLTFFDKLCVLLDSQGIKDLND